MTQIGDGENGGVMMNEFPPKFFQVMREASGTSTPPMNVSEYLDQLSAAGVKTESFPPIQPALQHRIWARMAGTGREALMEAIEGLRREDSQFHVEGGSWTGDRSWTRGYESVLGPMEAVSAAFADAVARGTMSAAQHQNAVCTICSYRRRVVSDIGARAPGQTTVAGFARRRPTSSPVVTR